MKLYVVSPVFILSYVGFVLFEVNCTQLSCHSCKTLVQRNETSPNCNRTVETCDSQSNFCGIVLWYSNSTIKYQESCVPHFVCINVTAGCPKKTCSLDCCIKGLCNKYDDGVKQRLSYLFQENQNMQPTQNLTTTKKPNQTQVLTKTKSKPVQKDTRPPCAMALMLKSSRLSVVLLLSVIKYFTEV